MRFESIHLINYRCHRDLTMAFKPGFNVIVGVNGSGKTSALKGLCEALSGFSGYLSNYHVPPLTDPQVVRVQAEMIGGQYRFEYQFPVKVSAAAVAFDSGSCHWEIVKSSQVDHPAQSGMSPGWIWNFKQKSREPESEEVKASLVLPVMAFYRASRHWNQSEPNEIQAATSRSGRIDGYADWWDASLNASALQAWVIGKCLERFQISSETGEAFDAITDDELALVNRALGDAVEGAKGLKYDLRQKSLLMEWQSLNGVGRLPTAFAFLSDGQRAAIGLVADIARRMCLLNPQLGSGVTQKTPGVVLIDELDMHLHPRWQRILTSGLKRAFPAVQFIVASHSPQVLGELKPDEIILLRDGQTDHPQVSYGLTSSQVLEEIMGAEARTPEVQAQLDAVFEGLERGEIASARTQLTALESVAPGIPELAGARALLRRKEVLGR